jgi:hypothetical protein
MVHSARSVFLSRLSPCPRVWRQWAEQQQDKRDRAALRHAKGSLEELGGWPSAASYVQLRVGTRS